MLSRVLVRLAGAWFVLWACLMVFGLAIGGTLEKGAALGIPAVLLGPPAFLLLLAWVFAPRR